MVNTTDVSAFTLKFTIDSLNFHQNSINGFCHDKDNRYFYKISNKLGIEDEISGVNLAKNNVPCSSIYDTIDLPGDKKVLLQYCENYIGANQGLLIDYLNSDDKYSACEGLLKIYFQDFGILSDCRMSKSYVYFIKDRIHSRFVKWYQYKENIANVYIEGNDLQLDKIMKETYNHITNYFPTLGVLCHGDPSDMNLSIKPILLDMQTYGFNPLDLEFASFFWNLFIGGAYIFPKYQRYKYREHNRVYSANSIELIYNSYSDGVSVEKLEFKTSKNRVVFINDVIDYFERTFKYHSLDTQNIYFLLVFRAFTIINLYEMELKDRLLVYYCIYIFNKGLNYGNYFEYLKCVISEYISIK